MIATAALAHFGILFAAYLVTGPLRATYLDGALGGATAASIEAAAFAALSIVSVAALLPRLHRVWTARDALLIGLCSIAGFAIADALVATVLCGVPVSRHFARFSTLPGLIQACGIAFHAAAPWVWLSEDDPRSNLESIKKAVEMEAWEGSLSMRVADHAGAHFCPRPMRRP